LALADSKVCKLDPPVRRTLTDEEILEEVKLCSTSRGDPKYIWFETAMSEVLKMHDLETPGYLGCDVPNFCLDNYAWLGGSV